MMFFDLRDDDAVVVEVWGSGITGRILNGGSPLSLITEVTAVTGEDSYFPLIYRID